MHEETRSYKGPVGLTCYSESAWAASWESHWGLEPMDQASPQLHFGRRVWGETSFFLTPFMACFGTLLWEPGVAAGSIPGSLQAGSSFAGSGAEEQPTYVGWGGSVSVGGL